MTVWPTTPPACSKNEKHETRRQKLMLSVEIRDRFAVDRDLKDASVPQPRRKRNQANYELAGSASTKEASELYKVVTKPRESVVHWLLQHHAALCPPGINP